MHLELTDKGFHLEGPLTFQHVRDIWNESQESFDQFETLEVDLADVSHCDSAALALLIEWKRLAIQQNQSIVFQNLPVQLIKMAKMSGVERIFTN
ncbi:MAG: hypothetical protein A3C55_05225 [Gammaproteobacteria bacterium RIFCSPHIGHO2_02_FULL_42_13]|nr:MAG: hypothetical protein A3C55_05225 [Gammaproteobacteria bacterium RIFCSPHIGHO2_02_FULL_42_13]OGT68319.1 MAG: hypothetical protein A3H43_01395 [Gammaproteobacteria bacterium RIFCSPLOWO2_02_FULL_42_9]